MDTTDGAETLSGTMKNGQVLLDSPAQWPEGSRVIVMRATSSEPLGVAGDEQADDPESVARWIAAFDAIPPLEMTAEEEDRWRGAREQQKSNEIAGFDERARRIEALFP